MAYFEKGFLEKINRLLPSKRHYLEKINVKLQRRKSKAPIQKLADQISSIFVPVVVGIAFIDFILSFFLYPYLIFKVAIVRIARNIPTIQNLVTILLS